jgi:2-dehydro-3-deoxyphosphogalactonate aldolase
MMNETKLVNHDFEKHFKRCPLIAILRGLKPSEAESIGSALIDAGIVIIEVPLNSPDPLTSIEKLSIRFSQHAMIGAGTVLSKADVNAVAASGGQLIVSPNMDHDVIIQSKLHGLISAPGVFTATEAFAALHAGADILKFFPGELMTPQAIKAMSAVLPRATRMVLVGGVSLETPAAYKDSPLAGLGIGSALFKPGDNASNVYLKAKNFVKAWQDTFS